MTTKNVLAATVVGTLALVIGFSVAGSSAWLIIVLLAIFAVDLFALIVQVRR